MFPNDPTQLKRDIPPQRDTDPIFAEDEGQPEVGTQPVDDSQYKTMEEKYRQ